MMLLVAFHWQQTVPLGLMLGTIIVSVSAFMWTNKFEMGRNFVWLLSTKIDFVNFVNARKKENFFHFRLEEILIDLLSYVWSFTWIDVHKNRQLQLQLYYYLMSDCTTCIGLICSSSGTCIYKNMDKITHMIIKFISKVELSFLFKTF